MPATYSPLFTTTVSGSTTHQIDITGIPATFTDLILTGVGTGVASSSSSRIQFNSDTGSNYSQTHLGGNMTTSQTGRTTSDTSLVVNNLTSWSSTSTSPASWICHFNQYANTNIYKTMISRSGRVTGSGSMGSEIDVGTWRSTSAITSISIKYSTSAANYFASGTIITLYGILGA